MGVVMEVKEEIQDSGLGLTEFIKGSQPVEEAPPETKPQETEVKTEPKPEEPKKEEVKEPEVKPEVKTEEVKTEVKTEEKPNWDVDDNPFKKRYFDTQKWANKINQENLEIKRQNEALQHQFSILNKKLDGTYNPEVDDVRPPDPDVIADTADAAGRIKASRAMAVSQYGEEHLNKMLFNPEAPFRQIQDNPVIRMRVLSSDTPVLEALKIVKEKEFFDKWGYDPETIQKRMWESAKAELKEEVLKELKEKISLKEEQPTGIGSARSAGVGGTPTNQDGFKPLETIFGR